MMRRISLGLLVAGSRPAANRTLCASVIAMILAISALSLAIRSCGVPRGEQGEPRGRAEVGNADLTQRRNIRHGLRAHGLGHAQGEDLTATDHRQDRSRV